MIKFWIKKKNKSWLRATANSLKLTQRSKDEEELKILFKLLGMAHAMKKDDQKAAQEIDGMLRSLFNGSYGVEDVYLYFQQLQFF